MKRILHFYGDNSDQFIHIKRTIEGDE
jgi:hypothetical protein